jgi:pantothenate kinase-related protein Tda10
MKAIDSIWNFDFDFIDDPNWQSISNIPQIFKNDLIDQLLLCSEKISGNWNNNQNPFLASIVYLTDSGKSTWEEVMIKSLHLASKRNLNLFDQIPELKDKFVSQ